jgi:hypothetical protein
VWCAGMEAGRPSVELACRLDGDHAARSSSCCCLAVRCWLSAHDRTSLIASSWTSARCAASGPRTRTISTELVSRRDRDRGEQATVFPTGSSCSSSAAAIRLHTTRRISRSRGHSPDVRAGHGRCPLATDRPPSLHGRSIHAVCQVSSKAQPRLWRLARTPLRRSGPGRPRSANRLWAAGRSRGAERITAAGGLGMSRYDCQSSSGTATEPEERYGYAAGRANVRTRSWRGCDRVGSTQLPRLGGFALAGCCSRRFAIATRSGRERPQHLAYVGLGEHRPPPSM